ncbi:MAG: N-formylglutamate amidohydrolase [Dehalococcoidia bacterium]|nr:N-formylglutamate amidohydrolase [Dehalococcoidia bacterium]
MEARGLTEGDRAQLWRGRVSDGRLIATAIHDGHEVRAEVAQLLALPEEDRLREEDPFTGAWTAVAPTSIVGRRSRFEVDLNRPRENAVYQTPADAWGLRVWREEPGEAFVSASLAEYDAFYHYVRGVFEAVEKRHGLFVVFDLHSYNHRRSGPGGTPADPTANPEVNIGTASMDRTRWAPLVDRFIADLRRFDFRGRHLDVRENVKFQGGHFSRWTHEQFPDSGCALAIEFKKFFMDEWSGSLHESEHQAILDGLRSTVPGLLEELRRIESA